MMNMSRFSYFIFALISVLILGACAYEQNIPGLSARQSDSLLSELMREEGWRSCAYEDQLGNITIGYGTLLPLSKAEQDYLNLSSMPQCIHQDQGKWLLFHRASNAAEAFENIWQEFFAQGPEVQIALIDGAYQLGPQGLYSFKSSLPALALGHCESAIHGFQASKWDHQTPSRVNRLIHAIREDCTKR